MAMDLPAQASDMLLPEMKENVNPILFSSPVVKSSPLRGVLKSQSSVDRTHNFSPSGRRLSRGRRVSFAKNECSVRTISPRNNDQENEKPKESIIPMLPDDGFFTNLSASPTTFGEQIENTMRWEEHSITQGAPGLMFLTAEDEQQQFPALPAAALAERADQRQPADGQKPGGKRQFSAEAASPTRCSPRLKKRLEMHVQVPSSPKCLFVMSPPASPTTSKGAQPASPRRSPRNHAKTRALDGATAIAEPQRLGTAAAASPAAASPEPEERAKRRVKNRARGRSKFQELLQENDGSASAAEDAKQGGDGKAFMQEPVAGDSGVVVQGGGVEQAAPTGNVPDASASAGNGVSQAPDPASASEQQKENPLGPALPAVTPDRAAGEQAAAAPNGETPEEDVMRSGVLSSFLSPGLDDVSSMGLGFSLTPVDKTRPTVSEAGRAAATAALAEAQAAAVAASDAIAAAPVLLNSFLSPGVLGSDDADLDGLLETPDDDDFGCNRSQVGAAGGLGHALLDSEKADANAAAFAAGKGGPRQSVGEAVAVEPFPRVQLVPLHAGAEECAPLCLESALNAALPPLTADDPAAMAQLADSGAFGSPQDRIEKDGDGGSNAGEGGGAGEGCDGYGNERAHGRRESTGTSPEAIVGREEVGGEKKGMLGRELMGRAEMAVEGEAATEYSTVGRFPQLTAGPSVVATAGMGGLGAFEAGRGAGEMVTPLKQSGGGKEGGDGVRGAEESGDGDSPIMGVVSASKDGAGGSARRGGERERDAEDAEERSMGLVTWSEGVRQAFADMDMGEGLVGVLELAEVAGEGGGAQMAEGVSGITDGQLLDPRRMEKAQPHGIECLEDFLSKVGVLLEKRKSGVMAQSPWTPRTPRERMVGPSAAERLYQRVCLQPQVEQVERVCAEQVARLALEQQQIDGLEANMAANSTALLQLVAQGTPDQRKVLQERLVALKSLFRVEAKVEWQRVRAQLGAARRQALDHAERMLQVEQQRVAERRAAEEVVERRVDELLADVRARRAAAERVLREREEKAVLGQQARLEELRQQKQQLLEETAAMKRELAARQEALKSRCKPKAQSQAQPHSQSQPEPGTSQAGGDLVPADFAARSEAGERDVMRVGGEESNPVPDPVRLAHMAEFVQGWRLREYHQSRDGKQMDLVLSVLGFVTLRIHIDLASSSFSFSTAINQSVVNKQFPLFEAVPAMEALVVGPKGDHTHTCSAPFTADAVAAAYQGVLLRAARTHALVGELWEQRQRLMRVMPSLALQPCGTSGDVMVRASFVEYEPFTRVVLSCRIPYQTSGMSYPFTRPTVIVEVPHSRLLPAQQLQHAVEAAAARAPVGYGLLTRMLQEVASTFQTLLQK
ncbi:hypothetical protein CLOM_g11763 [Closterium sp. NIES-68]|nr:hypothetical protein CLOM_g11763 [Closterium sp. NIES-68]GJP76561.1 hypothetical protein CLOP_g6985 [Closterium sp. NIES-67]